MDQSDVFEYGGHARYGTGPDFDRNYRFTVALGQAPGSGKTGTEDHTRQTRSCRRS